MKRKNLTTLPFNIVGQLQAALSLTTQLISQAQGIAFQLAQAQAQFARFYPTAYGSGTSGAAMAADALQRWTMSLAGAADDHRHAGAGRAKPRQRSELFATLVQQSQGAIGILQAAQATNQLLALQSRQSIQEQQLRLTQDRSAALEQRA